MACCVVSLRPSHHILHTDAASDSRRGRMVSCCVWLLESGMGVVMLTLGYIREQCECFDV
jgi:hypothetical protein